MRHGRMTPIGPVVCALLAVALPAGRAEASALAYDTSGGLNNTMTYGNTPANPVQGTSLVSFTGVTGGSFAAGSDLLGSLVVKPTPGGTTGVYNDVPLDIQFTAPDLHKVATETVRGNGTSGPALVQYDAVFTLFGHLDGTVQPNGQADLTYTVDGFQPFTTGPQTTDRVYASDLPFPTSALSAGPTFHLVTPVGGGSMAINVQAQAVPEPSTLAFGGLVVAGLAARRRRRRA